MGRKLLAIVLILVSSTVMLFAFNPLNNRPAGTSSLEMGAKGELVEIEVPWPEGVIGPWIPTKVAP